MKYLFILSLFLLVGCSQQDEILPTPLLVEHKEDIVDENITVEESSKDETSDSIDKMVDEDLSLLNDTMAYAQLTQMMMNMEVYEGKTVRIRGMYDAQNIPGVDKTVYTILIFDATSCCSAFIQLDLSEFLSKPNQPGEMVIVGTYVIDHFSDHDFPIIKVSAYEYT